MNSKEIVGLFEAYVAVYDENLRDELQTISIEEDLSFIDDLSDIELDQVMENLIISGEIDINECFDSLDYVLTEARVTSSDDRSSGSARVTRSSERPSRVARTAERRGQVRVGRIAQAAQRAGERLASPARSTGGTSASARVGQASGKVKSAAQKVKGFLGRIGSAVKAGASAAKKEFSGEAGREAQARTTSRQMRRAARKQSSTDTSEFQKKPSNTSSDPWSGSATKPSSRTSVTTNTTRALSGSPERPALPPARSSQVSKRRVAAAEKIAQSSVLKPSQGTRIAGSGGVSPLATTKKAATRYFKPASGAPKRSAKKVTISADYEIFADMIAEDLINAGFASDLIEAYDVIIEMDNCEVLEIVENYLDEEVETVDLYDVVMDYLLDEGYAETPEAAEKIMVNMSEDWRDEILDEAQIMSVSGKGGLKYMINPKIVRAQNAAAKEAQGRKAKQNAAKAAKDAERSAQASKTSIQRLNAKPGADSGDYDSGYHGDDDTSGGKRHYSLSRTNRSARRRRESGR